MKAAGKSLTALNAIDQAVNQVHPLNAIVRFLGDKYVPGIAAKADTCPPAGWYTCYEQCVNSRPM